jgi:competence protein ComFC
MSEWMAEVVQEHYGSRSIDWISFGPLHPDRLWEHGFSQAELLAGVISWKLGIPKASLLERGRPTAQQCRKSRRDRLVSLQGAFRLSPEKRRLSLAGKTIFLVDDVYTTGTTLKECAEPLRRAGAGPILAVTFAR